MEARCLLPEAVRSSLITVLTGCVAWPFLERRQRVIEVQANVTPRRRAQYPVLLRRPLSERELLTPYVVSARRRLVLY